MLDHLTAHAKAKRILLVDLVLVVVYLAVVYNLYFQDIIRFSNVYLNYVFVLATLSIPMWIAITGFIQEFVWLRVTLLLTMLLPMLGSTFFGLIVFGNFLDIVQEGSDPTFERLAKLDQDGYAVCLYRTDYGAMTSFGLVLRQEKQIFPGLLLVNRVWGAEGDTATIEKDGDNRVLIKLPPYKKQMRPKQVEVSVTLKPNVYW